MQEDHPFTPCQLFGGFPARKFGSLHALPVSIFAVDKTRISNITTVDIILSAISLPMVHWDFP
jgi:hypothetical protein